MLGGFGTWQPLVPELHCREERLLLLQSRARKAGRETAASMGGIRQGTSRHPRWSGSTHGGGARHGVFEPGEGSCRHYLLVLSAGMGLAALAACCTTHNALILLQESHLFRGPPAHPSTLVPSARPGGCAGPTLALPDCQAEQARQCGSAQGKGWSTPYHRPRWEPVLMTSRAPAAPQRRGGRREAAMGACPPPHPSPGGHRGSDRTCPPMSTCPRSKASQ